MVPISGSCGRTFFNRCQFVAAVQHERAPRAALASAQCPSMVTSRRHGYGFPSHGAFLGPTGPLLDMPAYHLIYPQPTFPFHFGVKPHGLGLPGGLGLGIFNCSNPLGSPPAVRSPVSRAKLIFLIILQLLLLSKPLKHVFYPIPTGSASNPELFPTIPQKQRL